MEDLILLHAPSVMDFRERVVLWGPISDLVPSTPIFDMYPIGFSTMLAYLQAHGYSVSIVNLAARMVRDAQFSPEAFLARLKARAFGVDLHWLPHAHGALEVVRLLRRYHPETPIMLGGYSSTYFHRELVTRYGVDYVLRGDSTEEPLRQLMEHIRAGTPPTDVPNLTWRDAQGNIHVNPQSYSPADLDGLAFDYVPLVQKVIRRLNLADFVPFSHWLEYPIMAALSVKGCTQNCTICGGSAFAGKHFIGRERPAFRSPERLAEDVKRIGRLSRGPVFILGDLRQAGMDYAQRFFRAVQGFKGTVMVEFFWPTTEAYMEELAAALPDFIVEFSPESHDPAVRQASGKYFSNEAIEQTIAASLKAGARRFDLFFMIGLPQQTPQSALETVAYCEQLLKRFDDGRLVPFTSPLAPFLDPGSRAYEQAEQLGYLRRAFTLEDHRQLLLSPTWKDILSYETRWMDRATLAETTYEAGARLTRLKRTVGLISAAKARETEARISEARVLMHQIDALSSRYSGEALQAALRPLKARVDAANTSTVCDKSELDVPVGPMPFKLLSLMRLGLGLDH